jgi:CheY-like chemotaxis protein
MKKPSILIADDDKDLVNVLAERCKQLGLSVVTAHRGLTAFYAVNEHHPDIICMDVHMPAGNGLSICEMLSDDPIAKTIPMIMLTGSSEPQVIRQCHNLCVYYVQKSPDVWQRIKPLLEELLNLGTEAETMETKQNDATPEQKTIPTEENASLLDAVFAMLGTDSADAQPSDTTGDPGPLNDSKWILHIEDDEDLSAALSIRLRPYGISVIRAFNGIEGYRRAFLSPASAIILDMELPNGNGDYVIRRLKENPVTKDIPVIVLTGRKERTVERQMINLGADAFMNKPVDVQALVSHLKRFMTLRKVSSPNSPPADSRDVSLAVTAK